MNKQAIKSQLWQLQYFFELTPETDPNDEDVAKLLPFIA